jgi:hypothetical protein
LVVVDDVGSFALGVGCLGGWWEKGRRERRKGKERMINKQPQRLGNAMLTKQLEAKEVEGVSQSSI